MMCTVASAPSRTLNLTTADTSNYAFAMVGDPRPAAGIQKVAFDLELLVASNLSVIPGLMWFATRANTPSGAPSAITGTNATSQGRYAYQADVSTTTDKFFVAPALMYKASSGLGSGLARVQATFMTSGKALGSRDVVINPSSDGTEVSYFPITGWHPTLGIDSVMGSILAMDVNTAYVQERLAIRTARDRTEPNGIELCETGWSTPGTGNSSRNTGQVSIPAAANVTTTNFFQLLLAVRKSDAAQSNAHAYFRASSAMITS